jgi:hypothetical protein
MIVNGKNVHKFMHEDLSAMHNIIRNAMNDNKNIDVNNMYNSGYSYERFLPLLAAFSFFSSDFSMFKA